MYIRTKAGMSLEKRATRCGSENEKCAEETKQNDATSGQVFVAKTIHDWPAGYRTKSHWKYEWDRRIKKGSKPTFVEIEDRQIPVFHFSQTYVSKRKRTELQEAQHEFLRRFWRFARHDRYLFCDDGTSTIDYHAQHEKGSEVPWFSEALMVQHLRGESVYGLFAQESYPQRPARTYWVAADVDLHLATGGNLEIFREQVQVILRHLWGRFGSQIVISEKVANGLHIYVYFKRPKDLDQARHALRTALLGIQKLYPELERQINAWNDNLRRAGNRWNVKQIGDLEIYPDQAHGFRFIGTRGKVVLADKEIGIVQWGNFVRGRNKGKAKYGFDLVSWWNSIQSGERMPLDHVLRIIESRLPTEQPRLEVVSEDVRDRPDPEAPSAPGDDIHVGNGTDTTERVKPPKSRTTGRLYRQTRQKLTDYWLGIDNPPCWFETAVIVSARLFAKEGLTEDSAMKLLSQYAREIPEDARHCSGRLLKGDWLSIDHDITKAVKNAFSGNGKQNDVNRSDEDLTKTIAAWAKFGFKLSDKATWIQRAGDDCEEIDWTEADRRDITLWLMPVLKIKDPDLAVRVATGIVKLTQIKDSEGKGWGYAYLKQWLPDNFGIKCAKQAKQAAVFKSFVDLRIISVLSKGRKGKATRWALGSRAVARLDGDNGRYEEVSHTQKREDLSWMVEREWELSPWDDLEGEGERERRMGLLLYVPFLTPSPTIALWPLPKTTSFTDTDNRKALN
jgi:hypothetical protein